MLIINYYLCRMRAVHDLMINVTLLFRGVASNLHVPPKTEIYLDFNIKNAGFVFVVEICDFSVFVYNFYSCNKYNSHY